MPSFIHHWKFQINSPGALSTLLKFMLVLALISLLIAYLLIGNSLRNETERMTSQMEERAQSLIWAIEGSARFFRKKEVGNLTGMLREIGRQPGIAWLAIVNKNGRIILDSHSELDDTQLYLPAEMRALAPGKVLQARPSPDDPQIIEFWKLFEPGRVGNHSGYPSSNAIFIALDSAPFRAQLNQLYFQLWFMAFSIIASLLCFSALCFYIYNYRLSRRKLKDTEALAMQVIEAYPAALILCRPDGQLILSNHTAREIFNINGSGGKCRLQDLAFFDWKHVLDRLKARKAMHEPDLNLHLRNGDILSMDLLASPVPAGTKTVCLLAFRDLSEINQLRKKLAHSEKLSEAGRLAAGLAHEIRNPLSSIRGYAHYLQDRLTADPLAQATAKLLEEETSRINDAVSGLLNIIRLPKLKLKANPLTAIIDKACTLVKPDADNHAIKIDKNYDKKPDDIQWPLSDNEKLLQVFLNILLNAIQAMPDGGEISISLHWQTAGGKKGCKIVFKDTGFGMSEEIRRQVFNPYFTTRAEGTGLGLAISRQILESHNGEIDVASSPGKGSIFTVFLPCQP